MHHLTDYMADHLLFLAIFSRGLRATWHAPGPKLIVALSPPLEMRGSRTEQVMTPISKQLTWQAEQ